MKKNNNPFESNGKNNNPFEAGSPTQVSRSTTFGQKKPRGRKKFILIIIIVILVLFIYNIPHLRYNIRMMKRMEIANNQEIVEDYTFDINDIDMDFDQNKYTNLLGQGETEVITLDDERFRETSDGKELTLIAGIDIPAGIYSISETGRMYLSLDSEVSGIGALDDSEVAYNIPIVDGDELTINAWDDGDEPTEVKLLAQSEYVEYEEGKSGFYVYGLSNFEPSIELQEYDYNSVSYCFNEGFYGDHDCEYMYDRKVTLNGNPGSYFTIDFND